MNSAKTRGFSVVEFMFAVSIAGIMIAVAAPSLKSFVQNNRRDAQKNDFVLATAYAKSESMRRGAKVTVCARATNTTCANNTVVWDQGWLVFVDYNGDCVVNGANPYADQVLQVRPPLESGNTLRSGTRSCLVFQANGFSAPGSRDQLVISDSRGPRYSARICVSPQGLVSTLRKATDLCPS